MCQLRPNRKPRLFPRPCSPIPSNGAPTSSPPPKAAFRSAPLLPLIAALVALSLCACTLAPSSDHPAPAGSGPSQPASAPNSSSPGDADGSSSPASPPPSAPEPSSESGDPPSEPAGRSLESAGDPPSEPASRSMESASSQPAQDPPDTGQSVSPPPAAAPAGEGTPQQHTSGSETDMTAIEITAGGATFAATLHDSEAARSLAASLPLTLAMSDLNANEKYFYLPQGLPTDAERPGQIMAGDLMLYGSDCLVLFYESFSSPYSYTRLGAIGDATGLKTALGSGNVDVVIRLREPD